MRSALWLLPALGCQGPAAEVPEPPPPSSGVPTEAPVVDEAAEPAGCLADLAKCLRAGIGTAQREPEEGNLSGFIASIAETVGRPPCPPVSAADPVEVEGRPVRWSRSEDNWSHHDDGRAEVQIRYQLAIDGCESVSFTVDLSMGGH